MAGKNGDDQLPTTRRRRAAARLAPRSLQTRTRVGSTRPTVGTRLIEVLAVQEGSVVAEIGAGSGRLSAFMSRVVGRTGRVYATDVSARRLREIRTAVEEPQQRNVLVVKGGAGHTNLPPRSCDAIFMRKVYHHVDEPASMNASLWRSLKPEGRLAIIDFEPKSGVPAPAGRRHDGEDHGILVETLVRELTAAGFVEVQESPWPSRAHYLVVGRRPKTLAAPSSRPTARTAATPRPPAASARERRDRVVSR